MENYFKNQQNQSKENGSYSHVCINTAADQQREYVGSVLLRREQLAKKREEDASNLGKLTHQYSKIIKERGEDTISIISAVLHRYAEEKKYYI